MKKSLFIPLSFVLIFTSCKTMDVVSTLGGMGAFDGKLVQLVVETGSTIENALQEITPEQEYYIGRAVAGTILENYSVYHSPDVEKDLNEICHTIVINSVKPVLYKDYYVAILDTDEVNAFATSGGHILISRGLLSCATSEDALAAVLSHEIAHIQLQHSIKAIKSNRAVDAILKTAETAITIYSDNDASKIIDGFGDSINDIVTTIADSGYSQQQEFEADEKALSLMSDAGYSPEAMKSMLDLLEDKQKGQSLGFAKTHPTPQAREANLKGKYKLYKDPSTESYRVKRFERISSLIK